MTSSCQNSSGSFFFILNLPHTQYFSEDESCGECFQFIHAQLSFNNCITLLFFKAMATDVCVKCLTAELISLSNYVSSELFSD